MNEDFYIGWEARPAPGIRKTIRQAAMALLLIALIAPVLLAVSQATIGTAVFEWGVHKTFTGILLAAPYPRLLVPRPGHWDGQEPFSAYYLVAPWKFGLKPEIMASFDGQPVTLAGTLIYRDHQTMIEVVDGSIRATNLPVAAITGVRSGTNIVSLGEQTLIGEIVDSKCFLGVMNPGELAPHRACAIRCLSGGVPPILVVRPATGPAIYLLLVSATGKPVNQQILDLVAEPVEITGEVERQGGLLIMRADPATYRKKTSKN